MDTLLIMILGAVLGPLVIITLMVAFGPHGREGWRLIAWVAIGLTLMESISS